MVRSHFLGTALALGLLASPGIIAKSVSVDGYTYVKSLDQVDEYRLDSNGMTVLLVPRHAAPVVTYMVTYHVGSRNEVTGSTGGTHLLEHLMFKGSRHFDKSQGNSVDMYLERVGAGFNATTSSDRTNYYATLGADALEGYIAIESDRMRNLLLRDSDRKDEMTVVRNEYERSENNPWSALNTQVWATAYQAHPYHHPTIGWRSDIENISIDKLRAFYDTYYWPNNATVTVVGDFEPTQVLGWVKQYYGAIPRSPQTIPAVYTSEPEQQGARRVVMRRAAQSAALMIGYKAPSALDPDAAALTMLGLVLQSGKSSRLARALMDASLATDVAANLPLRHDNSLFIVGAMLVPGVAPAQAEKIVLEQIGKIKAEGVSAAEITRVLGPYRADQAFRRDGTDNTAAALNETIAVGDWTLYATFLDKLEKVTPADVQRVARKYLVENHSTTGWFVPEASK
jgi:zinc protease